MTWHERAACRGLDTELFFPEGRARFGTDWTLPRAICDRCPVTAECVADADEWGMRGGLTPDERAAIRRARSNTPKAPTGRVTKKGKSMTSISHTRTILAAGAIALGLVLAGCSSAADTADRNLSEAAENFEVPRRIVGVNGITDKVLFSVEGFCSYEVRDADKGGQVLDVICLINRASGEVERTTLGLSDNVTFVVTQTGGTDVDLFRPRVIFRPEAIVPNFDLSTRNNPTEP